MISLGQVDEEKGWNMKYGNLKKYTNIEKKKEKNMHYLWKKENFQQHNFAAALARFFCFKSEKRTKSKYKHTQ